MREAAILALFTALSACSAGGGTGDVAVETWGEAYIEQGIPASEVEDGGSVTYSKFLIAVSAVTLGDTRTGWRERSRPTRCTTS